MKITQAQGNGQGQCALCKKRGKWNVQWMCFLYKVEGKDGVYCNIRLLDSYDNMIDKLSKLKIGCFANEIKTDKDNNIIDGRIRYINLCDTNIEKIEEIGVIASEGMEDKE